MVLCKEPVLQNCIIMLFKKNQKQKNRNKTKKKILIKVLFAHFSLLRAKEWGEKTKTKALKL